MAFSVLLRSGLRADVRDPFSFLRVRNVMTTLAVEKERAPAKVIDQETTWQLD